MPYKETYADQDEIHINKRTKISDPIASELDFQIKPLQADQDLETLTTVNDVIEQNTKCSKIKISGRNTVSCPADGVEKVTTYLSFRNCNTAFPLTAEKKILHCANCGCAQLKDKCANQIRKWASVKVCAEEERLTFYGHHLSIPRFV